MRRLRSQRRFPLRCAVEGYVYSSPSIALFIDARCKSNLEGAMLPLFLF